MDRTMLLSILHSKSLSSPRSLTIWESLPPIGKDYRAGQGPSGVHLHHNENLMSASDHFNEKERCHRRRCALVVLIR